MENPRSLIYTSTNKVYGALNDLPLQGGTLSASGRGHPHGSKRIATARRSQPVRLLEGSRGAVRFGLCRRTFGIPALVFRMSCMYGLHQMGTEDQGWVLTAKAVDEPDCSEGRLMRTSLPFLGICFSSSRGSQATYGRPGRGV